jgi:hypothetical protein
MSRPEFRLEAWHFTSTSALAREILALLEVTDYKLIVQVTPPQIQELEVELESCKTMGRVKVEVIG